MAAAKRAVADETEVKLATAEYLELDSDDELPNTQEQGEHVEQPAGPPSKRD